MAALLVAYTCTSNMAQGVPCGAGPFADPYKPLERCPIVNGRAEITNVHALKGKGLHYTCPLGVLTGAVSRMHGIAIHGCV